MKIFTSAIIAAAGNSSRMGGSTGKQFIKIGGAPVISWTLHAFEHCSLIDEIIISARACDFEEINEIAQRFHIKKLKSIVTGGETRMQSVINGIKEVSAHCNFIAVHDGARPLVMPEIIEKTALTAFHTGAAATGIPVTDTLKLVDGNNTVIGTQSRKALWAIHTPQIFEKSLYLKAAESAIEKDIEFTDDCMLIEGIGKKVTMVMGSSTNLKITTPDDLYLADAILTLKEKS